ncbi:glycosyltransferase family 92 protein [Leptothoe spongobia]|uniref:Glycosyltransferase family 92 protein n=1 Tax=Leptothoe spongobia TAU-MAC 1115 TaxID=1967444 RepID=A0A947GR00_9CYAN|nr:glycosyltransferase family 92 protein [Leptothoe spongobia]MBT9317291.1 glycosyltransferase family 92 protein [Leptothoe spongobia TAU-MAC 1115]
MLIDVYPVILPESSSLQRNLRKNFRTTDGEPLNKKDLSEYDRKVIFYDVFFDPSNQFIYALGPPLLNLWEGLSPISVYINQKKVEFELVETVGRSTTFLCGKLNADHQVRKKNEILIDLGGIFQYELIIPKNEYQNESRLTLMTLQKNNEIRWIKDWISYYRAAHGVEIVVLYDNNSTYQESLDQKIDSQSNSTLIVRWNFLYGPTESTVNHFCQLAALNHCRLKFGNNNYCLNFDIDEMLVLNNKEKRIDDFLKDYDVAYFSSFKVPYIQPEHNDYSYRDFPKRNRYSLKLNRRKKGQKSNLHKYVYKFSAVWMAKVHQVQFFREIPLREWLAVKILDVIERIQIQYTKLFKLEGKLQSFFDSIFENLVIYIGKSMLNSYFVPIEEGFFLDYVGITTNWKSSYWNRLEVKHSEGSSYELTEDFSVIRIFDSIDRAAIPQIKASETLE